MSDNNHYFRIHFVDNPYERKNGPVELMCIEANRYEKGQEGHKHDLGKDAVWDIIEAHGGEIVRQRINDTGSVAVPVNDQGLQLNMPMAAIGWLRFVPEQTAYSNGLIERAAIQAPLHTMIADLNDSEKNIIAGYNKPLPNHASTYVFKIKIDSANVSALISDLEQRGCLTSEEQKSLHRAEHEARTDNEIEARILNYMLENNGNLNNIYDLESLRMRVDAVSFDNTDLLDRVNSLKADGLVEDIAERETLGGYALTEKGRSTVGL